MKYLICNLKEDKTLLEIIEYKKALEYIKHPNLELVICPSYPYLPVMHCDNYKIGAQNVSKFENGIFTGEVSIKTLKSLDVKYVILGHSEIQIIETEEEVLAKINMALNYKIRPIYTIGEPEDTYQNRQSIEYVQKKLDTIITNIQKDKIENLIIAYEPPWLINTEKNLNIKFIEEMINFIKIYLKERTGKKITVIYGGGISKYNIYPLQNIRNLDGFLVGKFAQDPQNIEFIIKQ